MVNQESYEKIIQNFSDKLPHFSDGRIDYTDSKKAPVLNCFVEFNGEILLLKRSDKVANYCGKWNSIGGFLDEAKPLEEKATEEAEEELNIDRKNIELINIGQYYELFDRDIDKTWIIFPVLIALKEKPKIKLDFEHTDYVWIKPEELKKI